MPANLRSREWKSGLAVAMEGSGGQELISTLMSAGLLSPPDDAHDDDYAVAAALAATQNLDLDGEIREKVDNAETDDDLQMRMLLRLKKEPPTMAQMLADTQRE